MTSWNRRGAVRCLYHLDCIVNGPPREQLNPETPAFRLSRNAAVVAKLKIINT